MPFIKRKRNTAFEGGGLVLFMEVQDAMQAEKVLKNAGYTAKLVAPPPELRKGCDLAVEINLVEKPGIERLFNQKNVRAWGNAWDLEALQKFIDTGETTPIDPDGYNISYSIYYAPRSIWVGLKYNFR